MVTPRARGENVLSHSRIFSTTAVSNTTTESGAPKPTPRERRETPFGRSHPTRAASEQKQGRNAQNRFYRRLASHPGEKSFQLVVEQSDLWITVDADRCEELEALALARLNEIRAQIQTWLLLDPAFGPSMVPVSVPEHAPEVIRRMAAASALMNVGPMATVAGAVAAFVAGELARVSPDCIVENGGDSMLYSTRDRVIGLLPDQSRNAVVGLRIAKEEFPLSLCASSSFIGHSFSFGQGDLAVVRSKDAFVADAASTAFCNMLQGPDDAGRVAEYAAGFAHIGVDGVFLQCQGSIGIWGNMELTAL